MSQIKVNSIVPLAGLSGGASGGVLQTKSAFKTDTASFTTLNSATDPYFFLETTITPVSTSSKILIFAYITVGSSGGTTYRFQVNRGTTPVLRGDTGDASESRATSGTNTQETWEVANIATMTVDSPASTSELTYKLGISNGTSGYTAYINRSSTDGGAEYVRGTSGFILQEVSG